MWLERSVEIILQGYFEHCVTLKRFLLFTIYSLPCLLEIIKNKGLEKITVDEVVQEVTPRGRQLVPEEVKAEMLEVQCESLQLALCAFFFS